MQKFLLLFVFSLGLGLSAAQAQDRALLVVSSAGTAENPERGFEFDELSQAYWAFSDNGFQVDIASPAGGEPVAEGKNPMWTFNQRFIDDGSASAKLAHSLRIDEVRSEDYAVLFVIGGPGAAIDLRHDQALQALIAETYDRNGVVGAVCHGPAALVDVRLGSGEPLLAGRRVTAFTNAEVALISEKEFGFAPLETELRERGARFDARAPMMLNVVTDGRLVTGQNPFSTARTAEAAIAALGREPDAREPYRSEATMELIELAQGDAAAAAADLLAADPTAYEVKFIAILGFYQLRSAQSDDEVRQALALMNLSTPYFQHEQLELAMASAYQRLGETAKARDLLEAAIQRNPEGDAARRLLAELDAG